MSHRVAIERRVKQVVLVDSRDRDYDAYPSPTRYTLRLPRTYRNVVRTRVLSVELPTSFFVFSAALGNTSMHVVLYAADDVAVTAAMDVTIPDGNYNATGMLAALNAALNVAFGSVESGIHAFTATIDAATACLNITNTQARGMMIDTTSAHVTSSRRTEWGLAYFLGYPRGAQTRAAAGGPLAGLRSVMLSPYAYALLDVGELNGMDECGPEGERGAAQLRGSLCKVPLASAPYSHVLLQDKMLITNTNDLSNPIARLDRLDVQWRFHDGQPIDFRDTEHSFSLEVECVDVVMPQSVSQQHPFV